MVQRDERLGFAVDDRHEAPAPPTAVAFAIDEWARRFAGLFGKFGLLFAYLSQLGDGIAGRSNGKRPRFISTSRR